jgi:selenocysteine lyase/cysteine desulfurase
LHHIPLQRAACRCIFPGRAGSLIGVRASTRASFYLYNTPEEADALADGIRQAQRFFAPA